ncbi:terminase large subunit [Streptomyces asiaticus]|uniref:terminase large subunit n=1 Tax=Streptomyces asiaticus TaxID=114695 RepID=UPI001BA7C9F2|nr:terminase large subunit [Streptomyces asiaticus]
MSRISRRESLRGAAKPRVECVPPSAFSLGDEAVELARRAGLVLDPWQADSIRLMLSVREDGKWSCFEYGEIVARQNGKGAILEARALAGLFLLDERLIMWSAHEYKTAMEGFRRFKALLKGLGEPISENLIDIDGVHIKVINTNGEESFERLDTGARVKFIARSKGSGRGFSGDCNIIDEAFAYTAIQQDALMPTMSARPNPQIIYTSSPPLDGDDGSGEVMFALHVRAENGGDDSFGWRDWGIAGDLDHLDDIDLDDRRLWAASNPALGYRLSEEAVLRERRSMGDAGFARERLGVWPRKSQGNTVIDAAAWARLADPESQRDREHGVAIGVDISPLRDYAAVQVYGVRADGLGHTQLADYRPGTKWLLPRLKELREALGPISIAMGRGTFAFLETALDAAGFQQPEDPETPEPGDLAVTNAVDMAAAAGQLLEAVREESFRVVPNRHLDVAVASAKTKATGETIAWTVKGVDGDISPLVAMTLARWSYVTRSHLLEGNQYDVLDSVF